MRALGIIREGEALKVALLRKDSSGLTFEYLKNISEDVKQLYIQASSGGPVVVATGLDAWEVAFRKLSLPIKEKAKVIAALPFQLETLLPYSVDESIVGLILKKIEKKKTAATLFATKESCLQEHLQWAQTLELESETVSCTPIALYRVARWLFPHQTTLALFYGGHTKSFCVVLNEGEIVLTQTLHDLNKPDALPRELERLSLFLKNKQVIGTETKWLLLGEALPDRKIWEESVSSQILELPADLPIATGDLHRYALAIGLCLNVLAGDDYSVELRCGKWTPEKRMKKRKALALKYLALCAVVTIVAAVGSHLILKKKQTVLVQHLNGHLPVNIAPLKEASTEALRGKLREWEKALTPQKPPFAFLPNTPCVSDVLAWLSTHPALTTPEGEKKEGLEIKSLRYQLYKYPKLGETLEPYQARLDLEFTASSTRLAREFHDALLKGDLIVNGKKEIKWNVQNNSYFTSFELNPLKD